ncbi:MAG TPA: Gfo/Idh/MocA family oxidoreductase [Candidatus Choladousia intestinigallinarum]|nr:Gfo/Idh/MocA family oxidoreductase [Candidatus Choladousia intestinigallinarum]
MEEIRLGTIGSGVIVHSILDGVKETEGIRCAAVYSRTWQRGSELAGCYGVEKVYTDMDRFLSDPEVNFVYIATPNLLHYEQAKKALLAGKNVICEKPFCTKWEHAKELVEIAKEKRLFLVDAVPTAFLPNFEILKRKLSEVGKIKLVMSNYSQYSSRYDVLKAGGMPNIFNPQYAGGCLMDINFYNVYLNVALFGKPEEAIYYPNLYAGVADTSGIMVMRYDGFVCEASGAKDTWGQNYVQIEGEEGYIYVEGGSNGLSQIKVVTKNAEEVLNDQDSSNRWLYEVRKVTSLVQADDYETIYEKLDTMLDVMWVLEQSRKAAGLFFPGD